MIDYNKLFIMDLTKDSFFKHSKNTRTTTESLIFYLIKVGNVNHLSMMLEYNMIKSETMINVFNEMLENYFCNSNKICIETFTLMLNYLDTVSLTNLLKKYLKSIGTTHNPLVYIIQSDIIYQLLNSGANLSKLRRCAWYLPEEIFMEYVNTGNTLKLPNKSIFSN